MCLHIGSLSRWVWKWPVWLLFLARGEKVFFFFFARTATHVWPRTYGHARMPPHVRPRTYGHARTATHVQPRMYGHARAKKRPVWLLFLARGLKVFFWFFSTYGHARMATHVRTCESEGTACVIVVSGTWFESFFYFFFCMYGHALVY